MVSQLGYKQGLDLEQAEGWRGQREGWVGTVNSPAQQDRRKNRPCGYAWSLGAANNHEGLNWRN